MGRVEKLIREGGWEKLEETKKNKSLASLKSLAKAEIVEERGEGKYPHWQSITFRQVGKEKSSFCVWGLFESESI